MKRKRLSSVGFFIFFIWLGIACSVAQDHAASAPLEMTIETEGPVPTPLYANHPFVWRIRVTWYEGPETQISPELLQAPTFDHLTVLSSSTQFKSGSETDRRIVEKIFSYRLQAPSEGEYAISPAQITFENREKQTQTLSTQKTVFTVLPEPFSWSRLFTKSMSGSLPIFLVFSLILLIFYVTFLRWNRSKKCPLPEPQRVESDPAEGFFEEANRHRIEGNVSSFAKSLEKAVLVSMQTRFPEAGHPLLIDYKEQLNTAEQNALQLFVDLCVQCKYAPGMPPHEHMEQLWNTAKRIQESDSDPQ